jgi:O-antigen/teichoic acid export membrane protein
LNASPATRAVRNATALGLSNAFTNGLLFLWQLGLARWLGPEGYGVYGTIGALLVVGAAIAELGMGLIVVRDVATRPHDAGRYLAATLALQPVLAGVGYGGLLLGAGLLGYDAGLRALLAVAALSLLINALGNMVHSQLLAAERMVPPAVIAAAHATLLVGLTAVALAGGAGLWGLYLATLGAGLGRTAAYWVALRPVGVRPAFPPDRAVVRGLLADGLPLAITALLALAFTHADKLITTALLGPAGTGHLTAGSVIGFGVVELVSTPVLLAVLPLMARAHAAGRRESFDALLGTLTFFTLLVSLPIAVGTALLAGPLAGWLFGAAFAPTAGVLRVLIWYVVLAMVVNVFAQGLTVQNRQARLAGARAGGLALSVGLALVLLPRLGVPGAAVAMLASEAMVLTLLLPPLALGGAWWARLAGRLWRLGIAALGQAGILLALGGSYPLLAAAASAAAYGALILALGAVTPGDRALLGRLLSALPGAGVLFRRGTRRLA